MPEFALEPAERQWCARLRALAADRLRPLAAAGADGRVNRPLLAALGEHGLLRHLFEDSALRLCLLRESLAYGCTEAETALALQGLAAYPVLRAGTAAPRRRR
jgi:acyl-CoA dehydrogenase